jgi:hypothetical protein
VTARHTAPRIPWRLAEGGAALTYRGGVSGGYQEPTGASGGSSPINAVSTMYNANQQRS